MFPIGFDHNALESLPLPGPKGVKQVLDTLKELLEDRLLPYFKKRHMTDTTLVSRVEQNLILQRFEDEGKQVPFLVVPVPDENGWVLKIHERIFDYIAFVLPAKRRGGSNVEDRKMRAFSEYFLRHELEHILYPEKKEHEVVRSDIVFAMDWSRNDPTSYQLLLDVLSDELNGIQGEAYLNMLKLAAEQEPYEHVIQNVLRNYVETLARLPIRHLQQIFIGLETVTKTRVLGECYRASRSTSHSLIKRSSNLQKVLRLFGYLIREDQQEAVKVLDRFKESWGLVTLFHELDLPEPALDESEPSEVFELFKDAVERQQEAEECTVPSPQVKPTKVSSLKPDSKNSKKTMKERIEEARGNPNFPTEVIEIIDRNKMNAKGQSGAKYSELIETLLAVPWNNVKKIDVSLEDFERGLNKSHYGLKKPKEIVTDFFANLIWRYKELDVNESHLWHHMGSAFLFVGPPGVGKTSLAISIAESLGIPYHKISLGGMRDEADIRGYGFTYEGSKPGPIVQGLIKMGIMNGMFIFDETDKSEQFATATLLEILDPEQNHMFHDKYTQTTVDIDLSNAHFVLTANSLENVPAALVDRCQVVLLDRYSSDEKINIARKHLLKRIREKYAIRPDEIFFEPAEENELLRYLIRKHTFEAGVRDLERILKTLFLRLHRRELQAKKKVSVQVNKDLIMKYLDEPNRPRSINEDDRVGEIMGLGVNSELGIGSLIPIQATPLKIAGDQSGKQHYISVAYATGNIEKVMDESRKVAVTAISYCSKELGIDDSQLNNPVHLHFMGAATKKDGPSSGGAIALALASLFSNRKIRRDVTMTGEIDTQGRLLGIGGLNVKLETAFAAGCKRVIIPKENLKGREGLERFSDDFKQELEILSYEDWKENPASSYSIMRVIAVDHILQAAEVAFVND